MLRHPPRSTRPDTLLPYTTLFRSAALVVAPNGCNSDDIPNEDSQNLELYDTNLFNASRFPGRDRVEGGQRVVYGLRTGWFGDGGGSTDRKSTRPNSSH